MGALEVYVKGGEAGCKQTVCPLTFGDWMATIDHYMKDISTYSAMWWEEVCACAKEAYAEWLVASPLQRLRIKPELPLVCMDLPRTEQRGVAMVF